MSIKKTIVITTNGLDIRVSSLDDKKYKIEFGGDARSAEVDEKFFSDLVDVINDICRW